MGQYCLPRSSPSLPPLLPSEPIAQTNHSDSDLRPTKRRRLNPPLPPVARNLEEFVSLPLLPKTRSLLLKSLTLASGTGISCHPHLDLNSVLAQFQRRNFDGLPSNFSNSAPLVPDGEDAESTETGEDPKEDEGVDYSMTPHALLLKLLRTTPLGQSHADACLSQIHSQLKNLPLDLIFLILSYVSETGVRVGGRGKSGGIGGTGGGTGGAVGGHDDHGEGGSGEVDDKVPFRAFVVEASGTIFSEYHRRPLRSGGEYLRILYGKIRGRVVRLVWPSMCVVGVTGLRVFQRLVPTSRFLQKLSLASCNLLELVGMMAAWKEEKDLRAGIQVDESQDTAVVALRERMPPNLRHLLLLDVVITNDVLECMLTAFSESLMTLELREISVDLDLPVCTLMGNTLRRLVVVNCTFATSDCVSSGYIFNPDCRLVSLFLHGTSVFDIHTFERLAARTLDLSFAPGNFQLRPMKRIVLDPKRLENESNSTIRELTLESLAGGDLVAIEFIQACTGLEKFFSADCSLTSNVLPLLLAAPGLQRCALRGMAIAEDFAALHMNSAHGSRLEFVTLCGLEPRAPTSLIESLTNLPRLVKLVVDGSNLNDAGIRILCESSLPKCLHSFSCVNCPLLKPISARMISEHLLSLENLNYSMNALTTEILLEGFYQLPRLEMIGLNGITIVTDREIRKLPWGITMLLVQQTEVTETGIKWVKECTQVGLMVYGNKRAIRWERELL